MTRQISFLARAKRLVRTTAGGALALAAAAGVTALPAQQAPDSRWQPFIGCWTPEAAADAVGATARSQSMVCIVPVDDSPTVEIATISGNIVQHSERVTANGVQITRTIDNCPGWESATWSADGNRVFLNSNFACGNDVQVKGSGVLAIGQGQLVQVQGTTVGGNAGARVVRYHLADVMLAGGSSLVDSAAVITVPAKAGFALQAVRAAAGISPSAEDILDLSKHVDAQVAQAWVTELGSTTPLSAKELVTLSDAGLPSALSDLMIAMQYPDRFRLQRAPDAATSRDVRTNDGGLTASRLAQCDYYDGFMSAYDAYNCFGRYGYGAYGSAPFGLMSNGRYGYNGYNGYNGYGYNNYGNYGNYYYGSQPIIIIKTGTGEPAEPQGRAVKGGGYTRSTGKSTAPRTSSGSSSSGASSSGAASSGSGSAATSGGSTTTGRTAKPRTPPPPPPSN